MRLASVIVIGSAMRLFCQLATSDGPGRCPIWVV
jgi:hypothetical protein